MSFFVFPATDIAVYRKLFRIIFMLMLVPIRIVYVKKYWNMTRWITKKM